MSYRVTKCRHCNKKIEVHDTYTPDEVVVFCNDGCLTNYIIDEEPRGRIDTQEEILDSIAYHQQRDEL